MAKRKTSRLRKQISVWQALNEPIAYPTEEFTKFFFSAVGLILLLLWLAPYIGNYNAKTAKSYPNYAKSYEHLSQSDAAVLLKPLRLISYFSGNYGQVAGESAAISDTTYETPDTGLDDLLVTVSVAVADAAYDVLDISEQVEPYVEFFEPGVEAVWGAWLELMADPY